MANPYAFGQKDYSSLDRRRRMIDDTLRSSFETSNAIEQMRLRKDQQDRVKALASIYQSAMADSTLTPEQQVKLQTQYSIQSSAIGDTEGAKNATNLAEAWSHIRRPELMKPEVLRSDWKEGVNPGNGRGEYYDAQARAWTGVPTPKSASGDGSGSASETEKLRAEAMIAKHTAVARKAGADLTALGNRRMKDAQGVIIEPSSPEGIALKDKIEATMKDAQDRIHQIQGIMDWKVAGGEGYSPSMEAPRPAYDPISPVVESTLGLLAPRQPERVLTGAPQSQERTIVKTGTYKGKRVVQYSDGSVEYQ